MLLRARLAFAVLAVCLLPSTVAAQPPIGSGGRGSFPGCPKCGVWSWVDYPRIERDPMDVLLGVPIDPRIREAVSASNFWAVGWGFECVSGQPADRVDVWYQDYDGKWQQLKQPASALRAGEVYRPDIAPFSTTVGCSTPSNFTGWVLKIHGMSPGLRRVRLEVWWGPYHERNEFTLLVKP